MDMQIIETPNITSKLTRGVGAALATAMVATSLLAAGPAQADTKSGTQPAKGCDVENNGKTEKVEVGTRVGLFVCGSDGEWHFGWAITDVGHASPKKPLKPVSGAIRNGVLQESKARA
jgi:hypothetical protein